MFIVIALLFVAVSFSQQFSQPIGVEKARLAVDLLLKGNYDEVVAMFGEEMKAGLTADKLASGLRPALLQVGAVRNRLDPRAQAAGDSLVVTLPVEFANATMNFVVSFDKDGKINGLWMRPAAPPAAAPSADPAVAKANRAIDLVLQEKYADVIAMFSPQIITVLSEEKLRSGLQPILRGSGAVRKRLEPKIQASGGQSVVILPIQFEHATWDFIVTVNSTGDLGGLLARPGIDASVPWAAPAYSKPELFRTEEVTIGKGDWQLPGTLALPTGKARVAALVLVHGSGPNDRDESIGPQKTFRDLAEGLASRGIAVLRYEKRTRYAAAKLGSIKNFTVQDETVDDALAAVEFLRGRPELDPARVFVLGHSLGGYLIPRIGQRDPKLAGLISLAGAARPLEDIIVEQYLYLASLQGNPPEAQEPINKIKADAQRVKALKADTKLAPGDLLFQCPPSYWLDLQGYDPAMQARTLKQPMLILQGERDYQATMTDFARWQAALKDRPNVRFRSFPALNHLFQAGEGKSAPGEYMAKPGHVVPEVIDEIATWIGKIAA
jgi:dienelactone hydrolase